MKFYIYLFSFAVLFSFSLNTVFPQNIKKNEIVNGATGATLNDYLTRAEAFGFSGALIVEKDDKIILSKGYGWADRAKNVKNTTDTPFLIASVSKQFTAAAILQLEERGKLKTSDAISKYLKDAPADKSQITIHQLLTHTWGVGNNSAAGEENNREKAVRKILAQPFEAKPGEKFIYSEGYALLAAIVEVVSGQSFESYLKQNIFTPAKMTSAGFMGDAAFYQNKTLAHGYNSGNDYGSPAQMPYSWDDRGGSGIVVSPRDFYNWELALRRDDVISANVKSKMFAAQFTINPRTAYGYGWYVMETERNTKMLYHGGNETPAGYTAEFRRYPEENVTTILMVNTMIDEIGFNRVVSSNITSIIFGGKADFPPSFSQKQASNLQIYNGTYKLASGASFKVWTENGQMLIGAENQEAVNVLAPVDKRFQDKLDRANQRTAALIETAAKSENTGAPFRDKIKAIEDYFGKLQKTEVLGTTPLNPEADLATTYVRLRFEKATIVYRFVWNKEGIVNVLQNTPLPAITYFAPQSETDFIGYNPLLKNSIVAKFIFNPKNLPATLELKTKGGKSQAQKVLD
ncbi:MAG TPA: serine hydrolase domain-containing protein [Pyrinomonadaceae bacterium]|nr:serine hydrolase domain-containing protein [Pyrinomonadaceae bacterium]